MRTAFLISLTFLLAADDKAPLNRTRDREVDIHHMKIDVTVDLKAESVYGHVIPVSYTHLTLPTILLV